MDKLVLSFLAIVAIQVEGYLVPDPMPENKVLILLNAKLKSHNLLINGLPVDGNFSWVEHGNQPWAQKIHLTLKDGRILNLANPGLQPRGWCSAPGWLENELTVGCYSYLTNVVAHYHLAYARSHTFSSESQISGTVKEIDVLVELASELGGRPRLRTWIVRPFRVTTTANPPLRFSDEETASILATCSKYMHQRISEVLEGKYKELVSKTAGSQDMYIPPP